MPRTAVGNDEPGDGSTCSVCGAALALTFASLDDARGIRSQSETWECPNGHIVARASSTAAVSAVASGRGPVKRDREADPATTIRYDRSRLSLDRHPAYLVDIHIAGGSA